MTFKVYIPARYASTRLPGKPLLKIGTKTMLQHVFERALESGAIEVVIATDDERIAQAARRFGASVCLTAATHVSGTDRIAAAVQQRGEAADTVIVNVQGDEPQLPAAVIHQVAQLVGSGRAAQLGTVCEPLRHAQELLDPNIVKVVRDSEQRALYFSRAPIPFDRDRQLVDITDPAGPFRRHVGVYAYTVKTLQEFVALPPATLETLERLEQLRALANGAMIMVPDACSACGMGIDTPADLERLRDQWNR